LKIFCRNFSTGKADLKNYRARERGEEFSMQPGVKQQIGDAADGQNLSRSGQILPLPVIVLICLSSS